MLQGIVENSIAISEQLVELYKKAVCGQGKRQSKGALLKPLPYCLITHAQGCTLRNKIRDFALQGKKTLKIIQPVTKQIKKKIEKKGQYPKFLQYIS